MRQAPGPFSESAAEILLRLTAIARQTGAAGAGRAMEDARMRGRAARTGRTIGSLLSCGWLLAAAVAQAGDPWADQVVSYDAGSGAEPGYTDPQVALGAPERFTGEGEYPGAVTPFNPPWLPDEVVSVGAGGSLVVHFDEPITDDPGHLFGVDLIIFGNGSFLDSDWPNGRVGGLWEEGPFVVSISDDGANWIELPGEHYDAMFPPLAYLDLNGPYDPDPGSIPSDFTRPVDPDLTYADFADRTFSEIVALYDGAGGGIPLDIGAAGVSEASYVRVDVMAGATSPEFDAFATVPETASGAFLCALIVARAFRRGR
jgi:hypothetical protein